MRVLQLGSVRAAELEDIIVAWILREAEGGRPNNVVAVVLKDELGRTRSRIGFVAPSDDGNAGLTEDDFTDALAEITGLRTGACRGKGGQREEGESSGGGLELHGDDWMEVLVATVC